MAKHTNLTSLFTAIADAIRAKKGTTGTIVADNFPEEIASIQSGGTVEQATPTITVSSGGLITATAGTKSATKQLDTQATKTVTPTTSTQTAVASGRYTTGTVYVAGDSNLVASNIASGVSIFGVTGTHKGGSNPITVGTGITSSPTTASSITFSLDTTNMIGFYIRCTSDTKHSGVYIYVGSIFYLNPNAFDGKYFVVSSDSIDMYSETYDKINDHVYMDTITASSITIVVDDDKFEFNTSKKYELTPYYLEGGNLISSY